MRHKVWPAIAAVIALGLMAACAQGGTPVAPASSGSPGTTGAVTATGSGMATATDAATASGVPTLPSGWTTTKDPSGTCQVETPPAWQLGRDFFLEKESLAGASPVPHLGHLPPMGLALWGVDPHNPKTSATLPKGTQFQARTSIVLGDVACSVWRTKATTDFSAEEKHTMEQVGSTLQAVP